MILLKNNLKRLFKKKINIIFMLIIPIALNLLFVVGGNSVSTYKIALVDKDKTELTAKFVEVLKKDCEITNIEEYEISDYVFNSKADCAIMIDENYTQQVLNGKDETVKFYSITETNISVPIKMFVRSFFDAANNIGKCTQNNEKLFYESMDKYLDSNVQLKYIALKVVSAERQKALDSLGFLALGMMFLLTISTTLIIKDKMSNMYDRIMTTPLTAKSYYFQSILSFTLIAVIQLAAVFAILINVFKFSYGDNVVGILLLSLLFSIFCVSLGVLISRYSKNSKQTNTVITLVNLPLLMLGGCFWARDLMPEVLQKISSVLPTTWYLKGAEKLIYGAGLSEIKVELLLLLGISLALYVLSFVGKRKRA